ncbi:hypothetical protein NW759_002604 [Fusarium solani]|nr:hypothetical protein NW759_002604 [Fusarium solani]
MAETFGTVAGALSVAALFNNCADCFGYIQMGRRFDRDFERCQLKLDIAWSCISLEMEGVGDELSLLAVQDAASDTDGLLAEVVADKMEAIASRIEAKDILVKETARVRVGNEWSESVLSRGVPVMDKTENKAVDITARGRSAVHIGTSFGGRSIFD